MLKRLNISRVIRLWAFVYIEMKTFSRTFKSMTTARIIINRSFFLLADCDLCSRQTRFVFIVVFYGFFCPSAFSAYHQFCRCSQKCRMTKMFGFASLSNEFISNAFFDLFLSQSISFAWRLPIFPLQRHLFSFLRLPLLIITSNFCRELYLNDLVDNPARNSDGSSFWVLFINSCWLFNHE